MQEQLNTRQDARLVHRLRVYAAISGRTVTEVVAAALDRYLPPLADLVRDADSEAGQARGQVSVASRPGQDGVR
jgi:hypothetical protein